MKTDLEDSSLADQIFRSATSIAANYAEASESESRKDFIHKLKIAMKELSETRVWLKIIGESEYIENAYSFCQHHNRSQQPHLTAFSYFHISIFSHFHIYTFPRPHRSRPTAHAPDVLRPHANCASRFCGGQKQLILSLRASWLRACSRNPRRENCSAQCSHSHLFSSFLKLCQFTPLYNGKIFDIIPPVTPPDRLRPIVATGIFLFLEAA